MSMIINGRFRRGTDLSDHARMVLSYIDGGLQWYMWAANEAIAQFHFADERAMLMDVQAGLHASPFILLPRIGLLVGPAKLLALKLDDLRALHRAETAEESGVLARDLERWAADERLFFHRDFQATDAMLEAMRVASAPLFQARSLMDQVALAQFRRDPLSSSPLAAEAAAFAVAQARTVPAFLDYFRIYLHFSAQFPGDRRTFAVESALAALLPLSFSALDGPRVAGPVEPGVVRASLTSWLATGRTIGFSRASLAVQQVIAHASYSGETGRAAAAVMTRYLTRATALLSHAELGPARLGQDGATMTYPVRARSEAADLEVSPEGVITLARYLPDTNAEAPALPE